MHDCRHLHKLLEILILAICEDGIRTVTHLLLWLVLILLCLLLAVGKADLFHSELDSANLQDVAVLNFVVLSKGGDLD